MALNFEDISKELTRCINTNNLDRTVELLNLISSNNGEVFFELCELEN